MGSWLKSSFNDHSDFHSRTPLSQMLDALVMVIENPSAEKPYKVLKKSYEDAGRMAEADAIQNLITERFHAADDVHPLS